MATGVLSPEHIAAPLRQVLGKQFNTIVLKETVMAVDAKKKLCVVEGAPVSLPYDYLVLATGVQTSYFGTTSISLSYRNGTYEDYVGLRGLKRLGKKKWREHVAVRREPARFPPFR